MHRLFVAIRPPQAAREHLLGLMGGVSGARWQTGDQLHLTLRFIGEVDRHQAEDVAVALDAVRQQPFEVALNGVGSFEHRGRPETLWAGVKPLEPLKALHRKIDLACVRAGLEPERRAFHPHITLARLGPGAGSIAGLLETSGGAAGPTFAVNHFHLYESDLTPAGPIYTLTSRYPLR